MAVTLLVYLLIFGVGFCAAQSNGPPAETNSHSFVVDVSPWNQPPISPDATNWGQSVQGAQLSIMITNDVVESGGPVTIVTVIRNTSTNLLNFFESGPWTDYDLVLTNRAGQIYHLTEPFEVGGGSRRPLAIYPGGESSIRVPTHISNSIQKGEYVLKAIRVFSVNHVGFKVESNLLPVQIR